MRNLGFTVALFAAAMLNQTSMASQCPEYAQSTGTEIRFATEELRQKYGFQMFHPTPTPSRGTAYEKLGGKSGKVVGTVSTNSGVLKFHEVLVEDCTRVFWFDPDGLLTASDALSGGVTFTTLPPTTWKTAEIVDRLTDAKSCRVSPESRMPYPVFSFTSDGVAAAVVGGDFPGRPVTFRVDKNTALQGTEVLSGDGVSTLMEQIRNGGQTLLVGSYAWPRDYQVVVEFNLEGLQDRLDYCRRIIDG